MAREGIEVEGLNQMIRDLQAIGVEVDELKDVMGDIANTAANLASGFAPRRSGKLQASIKGNRAKGKAIVKAGSARVDYAGVVNYGSPAHHIQPSHFMQAADEAIKPRVRPMLEAGIQRIIERHHLG